MMLRSAAMGRRDRIAQLLARSGGLGAILAARARLRVPVLSILTYHHVHDPGDDYPFDPDVADVTPDQFRRHMELVRRHFSVIDVDQLIAGLGGARLPPNPCLISFDDGYRSNLTVALPVLRDLGLRAVFFVATGFVDGRHLYWWDRIAYVVHRTPATTITLDYPEPMTVTTADRGAARAALVRVVKDQRGLDLERFLTELARAAEVVWSPAVERELADGLIMTWDEIRTLRDAGMDIESHTRGHRVLQTLDDDALADELTGARADLTRELGHPARVVAYPVGRSIAPYPRVRAAVADAGYQVGLTNASGVVPLWRRHDVFDIGRVAVDRDLSDAMFLGQLAVPALAHRKTRPTDTGAAW